MQRRKRWSGRQFFASLQLRDIASRHIEQAGEYSLAHIGFFTVAPGYLPAAAPAVCWPCPCRHRMDDCLGCPENTGRCKLQVFQFISFDVGLSALRKSVEKNRPLLGSISDQCAEATAFAFTRSRDPKPEDATAKVGVDQSHFSVIDCHGQLGIVDRLRLLKSARNSVS